MNTLTNGMRRVTRKELIEALASIGIHVADGHGAQAAHRFSRAAIVGVDMWGDPVKMNGESNPDHPILYVEEKQCSGGG